MDFLRAASCCPSVMSRMDASRPPSPLDSLGSATDLYASKEFGDGGEVLRKKSTSVAFVRQVRQCLVAHFAQHRSHTAEQCATASSLRSCASDFVVTSLPSA